MLARKLRRVGSPVGVAIALGDPAGCVEWVNAAFQRLTGYTTAEMTGKRLDLLRGLELGKPALYYVMNRIRRGEPSHLEICTKDGAPLGARWLAIEVRPLGPDEGFVALVRDETERRMAEGGADRRRHPRRGSHLSPARSSVAPNDQPKPVLVLRPVNVSHLVMQSCELLEAAVSGRTLLDLDLAGYLPTVLADVAHLRKVVVSLVHRAAEDLAGAQGSIRVRTSLIRDEEGGREDQVGLEVRDTGWGPERVSLAHDVTPLRPTARILSLAEIQGIVDAHGGSLTIASDARAGTRALMVIPCAAPETL
jgi:PAS domain S-box-containing protein